MSYEVRIVFDGVIVTGPPYPDPNGGKTQKRKGPFFAVMPLTTRQLSRHAESDENKWYVPAHFPVIAVRDSIQYDGRYRNPDDVYQPPREGSRSFYLWYPLRERLHFAIDGHSDPGDLEYLYYDPPDEEYGEKDPCDPLSGIEWPRNRHRLYNIEKIPRIGDIFKARDRVRRAARAKPPRVIRSVATQVFVPCGTVTGGADLRLLKEEKGIEAKFLPPRTPKPHCKLIVPQIVVTVNVEKYIDIQTYSLDSGKSLKTIKLEVAQDEMIRVANADPENIPYVLNDLACAPQPGEPGEPRREKPFSAKGDIMDIDFETAYTPLRGDDSKRMPIPHYHSRFGMRDCFGLMAEPEPAGDGCLLGALFGARRR